MNDNPEFLQKYLEKIEKTADEIISDRQEIIMLNQRKNLNMQALRQLKRPNSLVKSKSWICTGNMFIELPNKQSILDIEKEQKQIDVEIENINRKLHCQVNYLNELEGKEPILGSTLKSLSRVELDALKQCP